MTTCTRCRHKRAGCAGGSGCTNTHMPALTRQEASLLSAAAAVTQQNADANGFIPVGLTCGCGQVNVGCTGCGGWTNTGCQGCGWSSTGCGVQTTCNVYGACHRGSRAGMAILYAAGVSIPGPYPMQRSCPWRRIQTNPPTSAAPFEPVAEPAAAIVPQN